MKRTKAGNKPKRPPSNFIPINMAEDELYTFGMELSEDAKEELFERNSEQSSTLERASKASTNLLPVIAVLSVSILLLFSGIIFALMGGDGADPNDLDGDGIQNLEDSCPNGIGDWSSNPTNDHDSDGCSDESEDDDDDQDRIPDDIDRCSQGLLGWESTSQNDHDQDGCQDATEDLDDDNDGVDDANDTYPLDSTEWLDTDGDGWGDNGDAFPFDSSEWSDVDGDGYGDFIDLFPNNATEWADADGDGIGDNSDLDDDNDGVPDDEDLNDQRDAAMYLQLDNFTLLESVDLFDTQGEIYFCVNVNNQSYGCLPSVINTYEEVQVGETLRLTHSYHINLDERVRYHFIEVMAYDSDPFSDDLLDLNPSEEYQAYQVIFDSQDGFFNQTFTADGSSGGDGDAGRLEFSIVPFDNLESTVRQFTWDYDGQLHSLVWTLNYSSYINYRSMNHAIDWSTAETYQDIIPQYAAFATPTDSNVMALAEELKQMANDLGYVSSLDVARFIHAFVGDIPYMFDDDSLANQSEYPKYPIEMLWEEAGDCEDASVLFISLAEHLGYDTALMLGQTKASEDDEWGGHAWAVIAMENHSGDHYLGSGEKSNLPYYFVETTGHYDGSDIGINPWYDTDQEAFHEIT